LSKCALRVVTSRRVSPSVIEVFFPVVVDLSTISLGKAVTEIGLFQGRIYRLGVDVASMVCGAPDRSTCSFSVTSSEASPCSRTVGIGLTPFGVAFHAIPLIEWRSTCTPHY